MSFCATCGHDRLLHDSWGCKLKCGCGVSIIYLASHHAGPQDRAAEDEVIEQGKLFDAATDRLEESRIRELYERSIAERRAT